MKNYHLVLTLFFLFLFSGCEKSGVTTPINGKYPYYLEAYLESGKYAILHISKTTSLSTIDSLAYNMPFMDADSAQQFFNHNIHALLLKDGLVVDSLTGPYNNRDNYIYWGQHNYQTDWWYLRGSKHLIKPGGNYQMVVQIAGQPPITASCTVPERVKIEKFDTISPSLGYAPFYYTSDTSKMSWYKAYSYKLTFADPPQQQNFYMLEFYNLFKKSAPFTDGFQWHRSDFGFDLSTTPFFSDKLFNGNTESLAVEFGTTGDSLNCINLVSISQGYYERLKSTYLYDQNLNNSFAAPVQVYSNFSNAVGFLAGRTVSSDTFTLQPATPPPGYGYNTGK